MKSNCHICNYPIEDDNIVICPNCHNIVNMKPQTINNNNNPYYHVTKKIIIYFLKYPTILLSLIYFSVTISGICYSYGLCLKFNIDIIEFSNIYDFLFAALKHPSSFIGTFTFIIFYFIYWSFAGYLFGSIDIYFDKKKARNAKINLKLPIILIRSINKVFTPGFVRRLNKILNTATLIVFYVILIIAIYIFQLFGPYELGKRDGDNIIQLKKPFPEVIINTHDEAINRFLLNTNNVIVIVTSNYYVIYNLQSRDTFVIPKEKIEYIDVKPY